MRETLQRFLIGHSLCLWLTILEVLELLPYTLLKDFHLSTYPVRVNGVFYNQSIANNNKKSKIKYFLIRYKILQNTRREKKCVPNFI